VLRLPNFSADCRAIASATILPHRVVIVEPKLPFESATPTSFDAINGLLEDDAR
jgi:hypothetical protein